MLTVVPAEPIFLYVLWPVSTVFFTVTPSQFMMLRNPE